MLVISGRVKEGIALESAEAEVDNVLSSLVQNGLVAKELDKVKNQAHTTMEFEKVEVINRAMNLAFATLSGDTDLINKEAEKIESVTHDDVIRVATNLFTEQNSSVLYYHAETFR
jgi:zinc protease